MEELTYWEKIGLLYKGKSAGFSIFLTILLAIILIALVLLYLKSRDLSKENESLKNEQWEIQINADHIKWENTELEKDRDFYKKCYQRLTKENEELKAKQKENKE